MALIVKDRVQETSSTTGTGAISLGGAVTGYQTFSSAIGDGNTTYYVISLDGGSEWEVGLGTYTSSGNTLSRDTILSSSNSDAVVNFSSGDKSVFVTYPAGKSTYRDASGDTVILQNLLFSDVSGASINSTDDLSIGSNSSGQISLAVNGDATFGSIFYDDSTGRTGINNVAPTTELDVTGTLTANSLNFQTYTEKVETIGTIGTSTYNVDLSLANTFDLTLGTDVTITFTNPVSSGFTKPITLIVRQPSSSPGKLLTVTGAQYTDGVTPVLSTGASQKDVLSFWSIDGGTTYFGTFAMANVS
jgi:hypothetical protein